MKTHKNIILRALVLSSVLMLTALSSAHAVTMNYTGGWYATTTYPAGAVVVLNKQTYYALLGNNKNMTPATRPGWWQPIGTVGNTLASGAGDPVSTVGNVGDFFIDKRNNRIYGPKTASGWPGTFTSMVGIQGETGEEGPQGIQGFPGAQGVQGLMGFSGPAGENGAVGPQGPIGLAGTNGANGAIGPAGAVGPQGPIGLTGPVGAKGDTGARGAPGIPTAGTDIGDMQYWDGTTWVMIPVVNHSATLTLCHGVPTWNNDCIYTIGQTGPAGGKVFYITNGGAHGLESAPVDQWSASWGCLGTSIAGTSAAVGTGAANTAKIIAGCAEANTAAKVADAYSLNGYDDWYLPSLDELDLLYDQKTVVGGFANTLYWSSTESGSSYAWFQNFYTGEQFSDIPKNYSFKVRAVRSF